MDCLVNQEYSVRERCSSLLKVMQRIKKEMLEKKDLSRRKRSGLKGLERQHNLPFLYKTWNSNSSKHTKVLNYKTNGTGSKRRRLYVDEKSIYSQISTIQDRWKQFSVKHGIMLLIYNDQKRKEIVGMFNIISARTYRPIKETLPGNCIQLINENDMRNWKEYIYGRGYLLITKQGL